MEPQIKADGWGSFAGGMHYPEGNHHVIGEDQAELIVNATVRSGWIQPRPAFELQSINWVDLDAQHAFESGVMQGAAFYDSDNGPRFIFAADGYLMSYDPQKREMRLVSPGKKQHFHAHAPFVYLQQRGRYLVAQDGINRPVIVEGDSGREETDPYGGVPIGLMMADGWHRLVVVAPDRQKIYISDHEYDPNSNPLAFTDDQYFQNARYFEVPRSLGRIVGIEFAPSFNSEDDWGPLLVFAEHGTRAYSLASPRAEWLLRDIAATVLPTTGGISHNSMLARGNDVLFSDDEGRIRSFQTAMSHRTDTRLRLADQAVWPLYKHENAGLRRWRSSIEFDNRILTTVQPERIDRTIGRTSVRHSGIVVLEDDHLTNRPFVWSGLWTGIHPTILVSGYERFRSEESSGDMALAVSLDDDGKQRLYRISRRRGPDHIPTPRPVSMWVVPRWMEWETFFDLKSYNRGSIRLSDMRGPVKLNVKWQRDEGVPGEWFTHYDAGPPCLVYNNCSVFESMALHEPNLKMPSPDRSHKFYKARPWLNLIGDVTLQEGQIIANATLDTAAANTSCVPESTVKISDDCFPNVWATPNESLNNPEIAIC